MRITRVPESVLERLESVGHVVVKGDPMEYPTAHRQHFSSRGLTVHHYTITYDKALWWVGPKGDRQEPPEIADWVKEDPILFRNDDEMKAVSAQASPTNNFGASRAGATWAHYLRKVTSATVEEAIVTYGKLLSELEKPGIPQNITIKELMSVRAIAEFLASPTPHMWNAIMDREEGKVADTINRNQLTTINVNIRRIQDDVEVVDSTVEPVIQIPERTDNHDDSGTG